MVTDQPEPIERLPLLRPVEITHDPKGRSLSELLARHEIDVILGTHHPEPHPDIAPLFQDARKVESSGLVSLDREVQIFFGPREDLLL